MIYIDLLYILEAAVRVSKWGNSLALRLPVSVVDELELKEGDQVEVKVISPGVLGIDKDRRREEALERMRATRIPAPSGFKFDRDEANER